jgi:hypothetical protein
LHDDDHDLHSSPGNMDYSGDQNKDVVWGMRCRRTEEGSREKTEGRIHLQDLGIDGGY